MSINLIRAKNADLLRFVGAGDNILAQSPGFQVRDVVIAAAIELRRRGRDPQTGKRLTPRRQHVK